MQASGRPILVVHEHYQADGEKRSIEVNASPLTAEEKLSKFYLPLEGTVELTIKVPDREAGQARNNHIIGDFITWDVGVETLGAGEIFDWSALIPPYEPTASACALTPCRVVFFDMEMEAIRQSMAKDCAFGNALILKMAQIIHERLRGRRIELLGEYT